MEACGSAEKITITEQSIIIRKGEGDASSIANRVKEISEQIKITDNERLKLKLQERLAKLSKGIAIFKIGGQTEAEMKERRDRVEDSLNATRAAIEDGTLPGGGIALLRASQLIDDKDCENQGESLGFDVVRQAIQKPFKQILINANLPYEVIKDKVLSNKNYDYGYNSKNDKYERFYKTGIMDPTKVTKSALKNAASISNLILTTECIILE